MDPLSIILTAIVTGAATALKPTAEQAVKDAYAGLKRVIQDRYADRKKVALAVEVVEEDPQSEASQALLKEGLAATDAGQDEELLQAAQTLLDKVKAQPGGEEQVQQVVIGSTGVAQATDGGTATVTISQLPEKKS